VRAPQVNCLVGSTFMVSDLIGDVGQDSDQVLGLFYRDMRHLSRWQLAIDGGRLATLSNGASGYPSATFFLAGPDSSVYHNPRLSVIRKRTLGKGSGEELHEKLTVLNSGREEIDIELSMAFDADFADLFEVKNKQLIKKGTIFRRVRGQAVELIYRREDFERRTIIHAEGAQLSQGSADFVVRLKPAESWCGTLQVSFESVAPRERTGAVRELSSSKIKRRHGVKHRDQMDDGSRPRRWYEPVGTPCGTPTTAACGISPHCVCTPRLFPKTRLFRRPDCRGSWLCSGATA
jgi:glycogen debranching enzyme